MGVRQRSGYRYTATAATLCFGMALAAFTTRGANAAVFPYTNDFSGVGANTDFPSESGGTTPWTVAGGTYNIVDSNIAGQVNTTASIPVTSRPTAGGEGFVQSTQFTVDALGGTPNFFTIGFAALATGPAPYPTASTNFYLADVDFADDTVEYGRMRILNQGAANADFVQGSNNDAIDPLDLVVGTTYTLRLTGTYNGTGGLAMTLGLFDAAGTTQIGSTVSATDPTPLAGDHFGYRNAAARVGTASVNYDVSFDNFQVIAVPEPTALALAGAAAGLLALRRRRRR
jgi:hypothetical protein